MGSTKEIKNIPGLDSEEIVVIKKIGFGSLNKLRNKAAVTNADVRTGGIQSTLNLGDYHKYSLVYGIKEAKFFENCKTAEDKARVIDEDVIEAETGQFIYNEIQKFNNFAGVDEVKKN